MGGIVESHSNLGTGTTDKVYEKKERLKVKRFRNILGESGLSLQGKDKVDERVVV